MSPCFLSFSLSFFIPFPNTFSSQVLFPSLFRVTHFLSSPNSLSLSFPTNLFSFFPHSLSLSFTANDPSSECASRKTPALLFENRRRRFETKFHQHHRSHFLYRDKVPSTNTTALLTVTQ